MHTIVYIAVILIVLAIFINYNYKRVKSNVDNRYYVVKNTPLAQQSADMLGEINNRLQKLIKNVPDNEVYKRRLDMYQPGKFGENIFGVDTAYTVNKGQLMLVCLDKREDDYVLHHINTLMYVAVHELAHVACVSDGHTPEFKKIFKSLLKYAVDLKLYEYVDYSKVDETYCGMKLTNNILT
jgi:hypothetical protein